MLCSVGLLDKLLELRIKFQRILALTNRLPSPEAMPVFLENGGPLLKESLNQGKEKKHLVHTYFLCLLSHLQQVFFSLSAPVLL